MFFSCEEGEANPAETTTTEPITNEDRELELLNKEIRENPNSPNGYHRRHQYFIRQGEYARANDDLNMCIKMSPETAVYYLDKARLCYNLGEFENSIAYAEKTVELDSTSKDAHVLMGRVYLGIPNYGKALDAFNRALKIDKYFPEPYFYKGMAYARLGDTVKAVSSYITATEQYSEYYEPYLELALIYAKHEGEERERALLYFDNALDIKPNSIEALLAKAIYLQNNAGVEMADSCYRQILELDPSFEVAYYNMGYIHLMAYRDDAPQAYNDSVLVLAVEDFSSAINLNSNYVQAYYNRGVCYEQLGEKVNAKTDYATALKIDPNFELANKALRKLD